MALNIDPKFDGKLICTFKNDIRNLGNFHQSTWKYWYWDFDGILLSKVRKCMILKLTGVLFVMTMKKDAKLEEELTCHFKIDMRTFMSFDMSTRKSQKFAFNGLPLTKVCNIWVKKVQRSYVWWHWTLMQNLKENWLLLSKMTWGICEIFTKALECIKIGILMGFFNIK